MKGHRHEEQVILFAAQVLEAAVNGDFRVKGKTPFIKIFFPRIKFPVHFRQSADPAQGLLQFTFIDKVRNGKQFIDAFVVKGQDHIVHFVGVKAVFTEKARFRASHDLGMESIHIMIMTTAAVTVPVMVMAVKKSFWKLFSVVMIIFMEINQLIVTHDSFLSHHCYEDNGDRDCGSLHDCDRAF